MAGPNGSSPINCSGSVNCFMPNIPSGNASHHTKILSTNCVSGCRTTNTFGVLSNIGTPVPDLTKVVTLGGTWDELEALNLIDVQYLDIDGFRIISPAGCGYAVAAFGPNQCNEFSGTNNLSNFVKNGIRQSAFTSFVNLSEYTNRQPAENTYLRSYWWL